MPEYFPDGVSILKEIADGDPRQQLNAMWHYLADGPNARQPSGIRRPSMEIVVEDEAVMLRRSAQNTGKRAISVGYPLAVNLTFDAESVSIDQMWRGKFVDPGGVWTGQGSGSARIMSRERVSLGKGPAFAELTDETAPWPTQTSRELGIRFKGYELDSERRPTFWYVYSDIAITDQPLDMQDEESGAFFRRTLALRSPRDRTLFFRAAVHPRIEREGELVRIDDRLTIRASRRSREGDSTEPLALQVRTSGEEKEVIVPVPVAEGGARLVLEYRGLERSR